MVEKPMAEEQIDYIIARLIERANSAISDSQKDRSDLFEAGHAEAYLNLLDILERELGVGLEGLEKYGLDVKLVKNYTG